MSVRKCRMHGMCWFSNISIYIRRARVSIAGQLSPIFQWEKSDAVMLAINRIHELASDVVYRSSIFKL